jgi:putative transposase
VKLSRQNYYHRRSDRKREEVDVGLIKELVVSERVAQARIGTRKLHGMFSKTLREAGVKIGRDRMFEVLGELNLLVPPLRSESPRTTDSYHCLPVFRNQIKDLVLTKPNQVWVVDLTYIRTEMGFLYLALVTDKMSRKIVGYHCGDTLEAAGCIAALDKALADLPPGVYPIHHSDKGTQYCCHAYVDRLTERGLSISMTETNHCAENALAERVNGILKCEYLLGTTFRSKKSARLAVTHAVHCYNTRRPHTSLKMRMPADVHELVIAE